jgi:hypothetical protein
MIKNVKISGLRHLPIKIEDFVKTIEKDLEDILHYFNYYTFIDSSGDRKWIVDIDPVTQYKIGYNSQIKTFMIWADDIKIAKEVRKGLYQEFEYRYPGIIEKVRKQWDSSAKEVDGIDL